VIGIGSGASMDEIMAVYPRHKAVVDAFVERGDVIGIGPFGDGGNMAIFRSKEAAEAFSKALQSAPTDPGPWVALGELYRLWDYTDQAITVAEQGVQVIPGANEKSDIYYVLGMGYDDKGQYDKSIEAFTKAIESRRDNHKAKFQRGQAYFRKGDHTNAKRDLEEFSKSGGTSVEFAKQQASKMLMDIAAKSAGGGPVPSEKMSPEEMIKKTKEEKKDGKKG